MTDTTNSLRAHQHRLGRKQQTAKANASRRVDLCLCALAVTVLMNNNVLGPLAPILFLSLIVAYCFVNFQRLYIVLASSWPLLLLPLFALCSIFWSVYPEYSLRYGLYFLMTIAMGVILGAGMRAEIMLKGVFVGLLISGVIGLVLGRFVTIGIAGELAFSGIQGSKNAAGEAAGLALIVSGAMAALSLNHRAVPWFLAAVAGIAVAAASLVLSKATGALIASMVASLCFLMWLTSQRLMLQARATILIMITLLLSILILSTEYWMDPLFEIVIETSGKDRGLTGRDLLWGKADSLIAERPWLGRGYNAFWVPNNLDAEYLWREMGIATRRGFNFHNTYREITVDLGYSGLITFSSIFVISAIVLLIRTMLNPTIPLIMASSVLVYFIFKLPFETFGFAGMHLLSMFLYTILAMGLSAMYRRRRQT